MKAEKPTLVDLQKLDKNVLGVLVIIGRERVGGERKGGVCHKSL